MAETRWREYSAGSQPSDWANTWAGAGTFVASYDHVSRLPYLAVAGTDSSASVLTWETVGSIQTYELLALVVPGENTSPCLAWLIKSSPDSAFYVRLLPDTNGLEVMSYSGGSGFSIGAGASGSNPIADVVYTGSPLWIRIQHVTEIRVRAWPHGTTEPTTWGYESNTFGPPPSGKTGLLVDAST